MKIKLLYLLVISVYCFTHFAFASDTAGAFLANGGGAAVMAAGDAMGAQSSDINSPFYNPAALHGITGIHFESSYQSLLSDVNYKSLGCGVGLPYGVLGLQYLIVGVNSIPESKLDSFGRPYYTGSDFSSISSVMILSYAVPFFYEKLSLGVSFKYLEETIWLNKAKGYGFDIGALWRFDSSYSVACSALNILPPKMKWDTFTSYTDSVPLQLIFALNYTSPDKRLQVNSALKRMHADQTFHWGVSYRLLDSFVMKTGINDGQTSYGVGFALNDYTFDYAILNSKYEELGNLQKFSVGLRLPYKRDTPLLLSVEPVVLTQDLSVVTPAQRSDNMPEIEVEVSSNELNFSASMLVSRDIDASDSVSSVNVLSELPLPSIIPEVSPSLSALTDNHILVVTPNLEPDSSEIFSPTFSESTTSSPGDDSSQPNFTPESRELFDRATKASFDDNFKLAVVLFQQALAINPRNIKIYHAFGDTYIKLGAKKKALQLWKEAQAIDPSDQMIILKLKLYQ